jgi:hypothetical protein
LKDEAILMIRAARLVLGVLASALCTFPIVVLTGVVVDCAMDSPILVRAMVDTFESPGWARLSAMLWSAVGFAGVIVGALPALVVTRSREWPGVKRLAAVLCGGGLAGAVIGLPTLGLLFVAAASVTALIMSYVLWLVAGR